MLLYLYTFNYDDGECQLGGEIEGAQEQGQKDPSDPSPPAPTRPSSAFSEDSISSENAVPVSTTPPSPVSSENVIPVVNTTKEKMMNNVLVYALADKYDIPELKTLAATKFAVLKGENSSLEDIATTATAVFTTTPASDQGLRAIVIDAVGESVDDALKSEGIITTMEQHGSFALGVLRYVMGRVANLVARLGESVIREDVLRADLSSKEEEKKVLAGQVKSAREEKADIVSKIDKALSSAENVKKCRHCHTDFCCCLERESGLCANPQNLQLRCSKCNTKHSV